MNILCITLESLITKKYVKRSYTFSQFKMVFPIMIYVKKIIFLDIHRADIEISDIVRISEHMISGYKIIK